MKKTASILCLIPARGGSKSIPHKNIRKLGGIPLVAHSIRQALSIPLIGRVIVSTDDRRIAAIARRWGAEVPFIRPARLAGDATPDLPVFQHALCWLRDHQDYRPDLVVHLRPTMPLRRTADISRAIRQMLRSDVDSVVTVSLVNEPPQKMWLVKQGRLSRLLPAGFGLKGGPFTPRQKLAKVYRQNGVADVIKYDIIMSKKNMFGETIGACITDRESAVDIDYPEDFVLAEYLLRQRKGED